jgi:type IVB pilus formation R64 PilN family outer membrane protein
MLPKSATFSISPANGQLTVTAPPSSLKAVAKYVKDMNIRLSRQVVIGVKVLQVQVSESDHYGLDMNAIFEHDGVGFNYRSPFRSASLATTGAGLGMTIVGGTKLSDKFNGSAAVIEALSSQGKVSLVTSASVTTLSNKIAPVQVANMISYLDSLTTITDSNGNPTVTATQARLNTGFTMEVLPRVMDHGRLMLMFSLTMTELTKMEEKTLKSGSGGGENVMQLPQLETRGFVQEIAMTSGETLVLSGFEKVQNETERSGPGSAYNSWFGGKAYTDKERSVLVILLTPEVMTSPLSPESRVAD